MWGWIVCGFLASIKDTERMIDDFKAVPERLSVSLFAKLIPRSGTYKANIANKPELNTS